MNHLIELNTLTRDNILELIEAATYYRDEIIEKNKITDTLHGKLVTTLFFEPSTRTHCAFTVAAKRLGALTLEPVLMNSALQKGESLLDTVRTLEAMGTSIFVIRHPENNSVKLISENVLPTTHVINAGDGTNAHPTQTLLELMTIKQHKKNIDNLRVAIVGDIKHSRVARSLIAGLTLMGVRDIRLVSPRELMDEKSTSPHTTVYHELQKGVQEVDVIVSLRIQKERFHPENTLSIDTYIKEFRIDENAIKLAKPDVILLHPGPMNRDIELTSEVADGGHSVILEQVKNGVAIRMAILAQF